VELTPTAWGLILLGCCVAAIASRGYPLLDRIMKVLMVFLAVCTLVAVFAALLHRPTGNPAIEAPDVWTPSGVAFLVALMGWMPTPVDASAWPSLWMGERAKQTGHQASLGEALFDFHLGYFGSLITALMFLSLGALVMFVTGEKIAGKAEDFAAQFVSMYTAALGGWSQPIVITAALITMLSTTLTVLDGYPRVFSAGCRIVWPTVERWSKAVYWVFVLVMAAGALLVFTCLTSHMRTLVDFATTVAFLSAPLFAYLNYRVVVTGTLPKEAVPPRWLLTLSWAGLIFLVGFSLLFIREYFD